MNAARPSGARDAGIELAGGVRVPEIDLAAGALVIADLHLDLGDARACRPFADWLASVAGAPALVVLGDLFDVWVGPAQARLAAAPIVLDALRSLAERGTALLVVPGNRDFLLDASFEARTGARVLPEGFVARVGARRVLCLHGDTLCTRDLGYQRLRRVLRARPLAWLAPRLPLWLSTRLARRLRRASVHAVASKLPDEKSIQADAVRDSLVRARAGELVCGHAHAFRDEQLAGAGRWIVLDAFGGARDLGRLAHACTSIGASGSADDGPREGADRALPPSPERVVPRDERTTRDARAGRDR